MAYRTFYNSYHDRLLRYLLVVTRGNEDAAREALQLTLLRVVRHIKPFSDEPALWGWLTVLARSAATDETRKRGRYFAFLERFTHHARGEVACAQAEDADAKLRDLLEQGLKSLPCDDQELMRRKYFAHHSVREIAGALNTTEKAVESRLARIRGKMKEALLGALRDE